MTDKEAVQAHFHVFEEDGRYLVDRGKYLDDLKTQIYEDKVLCEKESFKTAYLRGGAFAEVPNIRFSSSWEVFLDSWCENMLKEIKRKKTQNRLAIVLKEAKTIWRTEDDLLSWLKNFKNWEIIRNALSNYHRDKQSDLFENK